MTNQRTAEQALAVRVTILTARVDELEMALREVEIWTRPAAITTAALRATNSIARIVLGYSDKTAEATEAALRG